MKIYYLYTWYIPGISTAISNQIFCRPAKMVCTKTWGSRCKHDHCSCLTSSIDQATGTPGTSAMWGVHILQIGIWIPYLAYFTLFLHIPYILQYFIIFAYFSYFFAYFAYSFYIFCMLYIFFYSVNNISYDYAHYSAHYSAFCMLCICYAYLFVSFDYYFSYYFENILYIFDMRLLQHIEHILYDCTMTYYFTYSA